MSVFDGSLYDPGTKTLPYHISADFDLIGVCHVTNSVLPSYGMSETPRTVPSSQGPWGVSRSLSLRSSSLTPPQTVVAEFVRKQRVDRTPEMVDMK